jgi:hypothetical protein
VDTDWFPKFDQIGGVHALGQQESVEAGGGDDAKEASTNRLTVPRV